MSPNQSKDLTTTLLKRKLSSLQSSEDRSSIDLRPCPRLNLDSGLLTDRLSSDFEDDVGDRPPRDRMNPYRSTSLHRAAYYFNRPRDHAALMQETLEKPSILPRDLYRQGEATKWNRTDLNVTKELNAKFDSKYF